MSTCYSSLKTEEPTNESTWEKSEKLGRNISVIILLRTSGINEEVVNPGNIKKFMRPYDRKERYERWDPQVDNSLHPHA